MRLFAAVLLATSCATAAAQQGEWSGTYRCGALKSDPESRAAFSSSARLSVKGGTATLSRTSERVRESLSGAVGADGRLTLEGVGQLKEGGAPWRYRFEGRFEGNKFEARGAMYTASGKTALRDCTMTLTQVSGPRMATKPVPAEKKEAPAPTAPPHAAKTTPPPPAIEPAPVVKATPPPPVAKAPEAPPPREPETKPPTEDVSFQKTVRTALQSAATRTHQSTKAFIARYSQSDLILLAIFIFCAIIGVGLLIYDWRRSHSTFR